MDHEKRHRYENVWVLVEPRGPDVSQIHLLLGTRGCSYIPWWWRADRCQLSCAHRGASDCGGVREAEERGCRYSVAVT
jgi:hypothetical protein